MSVCEGCCMIDFGLEDPAVNAHFQRALAIIDGPLMDLEQRVDSLERLGPDTELHRLHHATAAGPLDLSTAFFTALEASTGALHQISYLSSNEIPTSPIVFQSLLRTALVGSARVVYVLLPPDPDERLDRAAAVLAQDASSGIKALERYTQFNGLAGVRAPEELLTAFTAQKQELQQRRKSVRDGPVVGGMTDAIVDALELAGIGEDGEHAILRDHADWLWNTYSGLAHGYSWPRVMWSLSGDRRIPGDFPMDLHHVATCTQVALVAFLARAAPDSAGRNESVTL